MAITTQRTAPDSHRISDAAWSALLAAPMRVEAFAGDNRRGEQRIDRQQIVYFGLDLSATDMPRERFLVRTRDLSEQGMGFSHSRHVEPGTRCKVAMVTIDQRLVSVVGDVASCVDRGDGIFNVGIRFDESIELSHYVVTA